MFGPLTHRRGPRLELYTAQRRRFAGGSLKSYSVERRQRRKIPSKIAHPIHQAEERKDHCFVEDPKSTDVKLSEAQAGAPWSSRCLAIVTAMRMAAFIFSSLARFFPAMSNAVP
jgi:hypothetical protein